MTFDKAVKGRLGRRLRQVRTQHGRTIKEVAEEIGVSAPALWRWEKGEARPRDKNLRAFASAFNLSEAALLAGIEEPTFESNAGVPEAASPVEARPPNSKPMLSEVIVDSKQRIAKVAGAVPAQIKIIIEV